MSLPRRAFNRLAVRALAGRPRRFGEELRRDGVPHGGDGMPGYRSHRTTQGPTQMAARALWRATGTAEADLDRPIVAIANSYTQFVPGHVHLRPPGDLVAGEIHRAGAVAKEFHTIAVDDGIAMGHEGMLYSLPSRELIADAVEYMVNAHRADALVCISNCDKITPGMLMAALRLNLPTIFVSGGPMEAGQVPGSGALVDAADALVAGGRRGASADELLALERVACPTCGSCAGMFTANSMNCLVEALGLALPGNGTLVATHARREGLFREAGRRIVELTRRHYAEGAPEVLPRAVATRAAFENAMSVDIAMGGSTNTILHLLAAAFEGDVVFGLDDIDRLSRRVPHLCKVSPSLPRYHMEDVHRAGGIMGILGELDRAGLLDTSVRNVLGESLAETLGRWDVRRTGSEEVRDFYRAAPGRRPSLSAFSQAARYDALDLDRAAGCIREVAHAYSRDGDLAVLRGNLARDGGIVKTAGVDPALRSFRGRARVFESENDTAPPGRGQGEGEVPKLTRSDSTAIVGRNPADATTMRATSSHDAVLADFLLAIAPVRSRILRLILFGSRARRDHRTDSDYDLLVVVPGRDAALMEVLYDAVMDVLLAHGRVVSLKVLEEPEYERLRALETPLMQRIAEEGVAVG